MSRKTVDSQAFFILLACCFAWGLQSILLKWGQADMPSVLQLAIRSGGSALCLLVWLGYREIPLIPPRRLWGAGFVVGVLFAGEFLMVGQSVRYTFVSHLTVCVYTAPIFVAIGMHFHSANERLSIKQWCGVLLAFGGIALAFLLPEWFNPAAVTATTPKNVLLGNFFGILAGAFWGVTTLAVRYSNLSEAKPEHTLLFQLLGGFVLLTLLSLIPPMMGGDPLMVRWTMNLTAILVFQCVAVSFVSYLAWFWLLRHYMASSISVFSFMTPLFGIGLSALLLDEKITFPVVIGTIMVMLGIALVSATHQAKAT